MTKHRISEIPWGHYLLAHCQLSSLPYSEMRAFVIAGQSYPPLGYY